MNMKAGGTRGQRGTKGEQGELGTKGNLGGGGQGDKEGPMGNKGNLEPRGTRGHGQIFVGNKGTKKKIPRDRGKHRPLTCFPNSSS